MDDAHTILSPEAPAHESFTSAAASLVEAGRTISGVVP